MRATLHLLALATLGLAPLAACADATELTPGITCKQANECGDGLACSFNHCVVPSQKTGVPFWSTKYLPFALTLTGCTMSAAGDRLDTIREVASHARVVRVTVLITTSVVIVRPAVAKDEGLTRSAPAAPADHGRGVAPSPGFSAAGAALTFTLSRMKPCDSPPKMRPV